MPDNTQYSNQGEKDIVSPDFIKVWLYMIYFSLGLVSR